MLIPCWVVTCCRYGLWKARKKNQKQANTRMREVTMFNFFWVKTNEKKVIALHMGSRYPHITILPLNDTALCIKVPIRFGWTILQNRKCSHCTKLSDFIDIHEIYAPWNITIARCSCVCSMMWANFYFYVLFFRE